MSFNGNLQPTTDSGYDLANKGSIHTHNSSANVGLTVGSDTEILQANSSTSTGLEWVTVGDSVTNALIMACSDEDSALEVGTDVGVFRMPYGFTLSAVRASLTTAGTGANLVTVDINEAGVSILSTKITIDAGETTSTTAATPAVISDSALANDAQISIDIDQIDSGGVSAGLKVYLIGNQT